MKKATFRLVVAVCLSISFLYSSAQHQDALKGIRDSLQDVQKVASELQKDFDRESAISDKTFAGLSNQLTMASYAVVFFTALLTISGFICNTGAVYSLPLGQHQSIHEKRLT
jgi:hypothetical protein